MAVNYFQISDEQRQRLLYPQTTTPVQNNAYNVIGQKAATTVNNQNQGGGFLENVLGGLGRSAENVGRSVLGLIGTGGAAVRDLAGGSTSRTLSLKDLQDTINYNRNLEGADQKVVDSYQKALDTAKANGWDKVTGYWDDDGMFKIGGEGKNQSEFKKWLYGENEKTGTANYAKAAGESLDAAATLSNFIPGANGLVGNTLQGAAGAFGQTYADTGGDLESALKAAAAGGAAGLATGGLNKGLNNTLAKGGKLANFATKHPLLNTAARGAVSGAVGGGVGGGTSAALNGGDVMAGISAGAGQGAASGLTAAPIMYGVNKAVTKVPGLKQTIGGAQTALNEMDQDYQNAKANGQRYYGFGSDNKAETAPGSIRNTYIGGDIVEGAEKAGRYAIDKAKNPMLGMGIKDVSKQQEPEIPQTNKIANQSLVSSEEAINPDLMYGESELAGRTAAQNRGNMIQRLGELMEGAQSNTTRTQNQKLGLKSAGKTVDKVYKKTGISDLDVQAELAKELTGGPKSYLDEIQRTALSATEDGSKRTVDTSEIVAKIEPLVEEQISETNLSGNERQKFINSLRRDVQKGDTITAANKLKRQARILFDKKSDMKPVDMEKALVFSELADNLDDLSYSAVPKDNVDAMFETAISESRGRAEQAKKVGNQQIATAYEKIAKNLEELPRTIQAYRSFKKDFVDVAKMGELSALGEQAVLAQNGANLTGNIKRFVNKALQKPTNQALAWAGSKVSDFGESLGNKPTQTPTTAATTNQAVDLQNPTNLFNLIGQKQGTVAAENSLEGQLANMNTEPASQALSTGLEGGYYSGADVYGNATAPTTYGASQTAQASTGNSMLSRIENGIQNALNAGDFESVEYLIDMYNNLAKVYPQNEQKQTKLTEAQRKAYAAESTLNELLNMGTDDTGNYWMRNIPVVGTTLQNITGGDKYTATADSLALQIGFLLSGANVPDDEKERIKNNYIPLPTDSPAVKEQKLKLVRNILNDFKQTYAE